MTRFRAVSVLGVLAMAAVPALAADNLVGHKVGVSRYGGKPAVGKAYTVTMRAGQNGNPAAFALPANPIVGGGYAIVERDGGFLRDELTAGTWTGLGTPAGSKGWKYRNTAAPVGGAVKILLIKERVIRLVAKSTGSMPPPSATSGGVDTTIAADGERYCARAVTPHFAEVDGRLIKSKDQAPAPGCPICLVGTDSDGDRLDDCYESDDGVFASPTAAGTDPLDADTDDDGIEDGDEVIGTSGHLDLPAMGTNPLRRDMLLEYDWFDDNLECGPHSHAPTPAALAMVTAMFAGAPVANPDGSTGIHFIHDYGQGGAFTGGSRIPDSDGVLDGGVNDLEFLNHKLLHFAVNRHGYFHYTVLPHRYNLTSLSSGQAELPGDDLIVSLACFGFDDYVAHTIAHELGHNLDLRHGGIDHCNYKPNYNSVMNYRYQFPGVDDDCTPPGDGILDYSSGVRLTLDENNLDENVGICGAPAWDWNGNTVFESGVAFNVNPGDMFEAVLCGSTLSTLADYDDWGNLSFGGLSESDGARRGPTEIIDCDNPPPPR
jgi:hypothetical protein